MSVSLGYRPVGLTLTVTPASTFAAALRSSAGAWADGTGISLVFHTADGSVVATWAAAISGDTASWTEPPTEVDALIAAAPSRVVLWYTDGTYPIEWARGVIEVAT